MEQKNTIFENEGFDEVTKAYLMETTRWTKFIAIMGFIIVGILVLAALVVMVFGSTFSSLSSDLAGIGLGIGVGLIYLFFAFLYFYPVLELFKFSSCMKRGLNTGSQELVTEAFRHQKNMYKFTGILLIIIIVLYLILFLFAGLSGLISR